MRSLCCAVAGGTRRELAGVVVVIDGRFRSEIVTSVPSSCHRGISPDGRPSSRLRLDWPEYMASSLYMRPCTYVRLAVLPAGQLDSDKSPLTRPEHRPVSMSCTASSVGDLSDEVRSASKRPRVETCVPSGCMSSAYFLLWKYLLLILKTMAASVHPCGSFSSHSSDLLPQMYCIFGYDSFGSR